MRITTLRPSASTGVAYGAISVSACHQARKPVLSLLNAASMPDMHCAGNYDTFLKTVRENEVIQDKKRQKEQDDIKHLKEFIASAGTYANLVKQAQSEGPRAPPCCADLLETPAPS